jgi:hypothetical protein
MINFVDFEKNTCIMVTIQDERMLELMFAKRNVATSLTFDANTPLSEAR